MNSQPKTPFSTELFGKFLINYPLYRKLFANPPSGLTLNLLRLLPQNIYCYCERCEREQPFQNHRSKYFENSAKPQRPNSIVGQSTHEWKVDVTGVYYICYRCRICEDSALSWWVEVGPSIQTADHHLYFRKVGQLPPFELPIDRKLAKKLGKQDEACSRQHRFVSVNHTV